MSRSNRTSYFLRETEPIYYRTMEQVTSLEGFEILNGIVDNLGQENVPGAQEMPSDNIHAPVPLDSNTQIQLAPANPPAVPTNEMQQIMQMLTSMQNGFQDMSSQMQSMSSEIQRTREELGSTVRELKADIQRQETNIMRLQESVSDNLNSLRHDFEMKLTLQEAGIEAKLKQNVTQCELRVSEFQSHVTEQIEAVRESQETVSTQLNQKLSNLEREQTALCGMLTNEVKDTLDQQLASLDRHIESKLQHLEAHHNATHEKVTARVQTLEKQIDTVLGTVRETNTPELEIVEAPSVTPERLDTAVPTSCPNTCVSANVNLNAPPLKIWADQVPRFEGKTLENPVSFLKRLEDYATVFGLCDIDLFRSLSIVLKGNAYFWFEVVKHTICSFAEFKSKFLEQYWSSRIQNSLRAQLHSEKFAPGRGKTLEVHLAEIYEKTRHLSPPIQDAELILIILAQLPFRFQTHWTGKYYQDFASFRDDLLQFDRIDRLQKQTARESNPHHESAPPPLYQPYSQRETGPQRHERNARVNTLHATPEGSSPRRKKRNNKRNKHYPPRRYQEGQHRREERSYVQHHARDEDRRRNRTEWEYERGFDHERRDPRPSTQNTPPETRTWTNHERAVGHNAWRNDYQPSPRDTTTTLWEGGAQGQAHSAANLWTAPGTCELLHATQPSKNVWTPTTNYQQPMWSPYVPPPQAAQNSKLNC